MWDNLFRIVLLNLGFLAVSAALIYLPYFLRFSPPLFFGSMALGIALLFLYAGIMSEATAKMTGYSRPEWSVLTSGFKATFRQSLIFALANGVLVFLLSIALPVYGKMKTMFGSLAFAFLFWFFLLWFLASQYFFPILAQLDRRTGKIIKKMFLILLDNPLFTVGMFVVSLVIVGLSVFTAFLLPGIASLFLWWNAGLKLRLYKYDFLEKNPGKGRSIPWDALLVEDRERVGKRTLKGMIFPWKE